MTARWSMFASVRIRRAVSLSLVRLAGIRLNGRVLLGD